MTNKLRRTKSSKKIEVKPDPRLKYNDNMPKRVYDLCLLGLTDEQLAVAFGVCFDTINEWKKMHPRFKKMLMAGKMMADAEVAKSLFKKANGYDYKEEKVFVVNGTLQTATVIKHQPIDTRACMYWMNNRQKSNWKAESNLKVVGDSNNPIQINHTAGSIENMDLSNLSMEELELAEKIALDNPEILQENEEVDGVNKFEDDDEDIIICEGCGFPIEICECTE